MNNDALIAMAERVVAAEGKAIAALVGRQPNDAQGISFKIDEQGDGVANCSGKTITLFKKYMDKYPWDIAGVVVHEATHAIQCSFVYEGDFKWMVEGLADFVRHKLGYGKIQSGDPSQSYQVAGGFYNWLYDRPNDQQKTYFAFVKDVTNGVRPGNLEALLAEYNCGIVKRNFFAAAPRKDKLANDNTVTPPLRKTPKKPSL